MSRDASSPPASECTTQDFVPAHSTMPISSNARGTYSVKFPCARIARIRGSLPPSPNMTLNFARNTLTRALITTRRMPNTTAYRSEEHTSELQSRENLVSRLLLEKKKTHTISYCH